MDSAKVIWDFLKGKGLNNYAVAGIMGNLYAESGLIPNNLQQTFNASLGMSDEQYTAAVDNGSYNNFVYDTAGYGLAQWTYYSRKQGLLDLAKKTKRSIGDLSLQLDYLWDELQDYTNVLKELANAQSVWAASNVILNEYEIPYDRGTAVQNYRAEQGQRYYNMFANTQTDPVIVNPVVTPVVSDTDVYCVVTVAHYSNLDQAKVKQAELKASGLNAFIIFAKA